MSVFYVLSTSVVLLTLGIAVCCSKPKVRVFDLTDRLVPYKDAWEWQTALMNHQIELQSQNSAQTPVGHVIMLQHRSVYTLGTASEKGSGPFSTTTKDGRLLEYDLFETERAGQATYHGPGQVVLYPILDLTQFERDINTYLRGLEEVTIDTLNAYGVEGTRKDGLTGVWVGPSKVAAIGIKLRRWVTMHGIALNVAPDMRYFDNIVPCGIADEALSVGALSDWCPDATVPHVAGTFLRSFLRHYDLDADHLRGDEAIEQMYDILGGSGQGMK